MMSISVNQYLDLIPNANRDKPKFIDSLSALIQPLVDLQNQYSGIPQKLDIDYAKGDQLDILGEWIGISRNVSIPLNVYFTLDTDGLGLDDGLLKGPFSGDSGITVLTDTYYRKVLKAKIAQNHWDGSIQNAYKFLDPLFGGILAIYDNHNMSMYVGIIGGSNDATTRALFEGGYLSVKPSGVKLTNFIYPSAPFGLDFDSETLSGLDSGLLLP